MAYFKIYIYLFLALGLGLGTLAVYAEEGEVQNSPHEERPFPYRYAEARPAEEMLNASELAIYHQSLEADDCDPAYALLANAYVKTFPDELHPGSSRRIGGNWINIVGIQFYPELTLCIYMRDIRETSAEIDRLGLDVPRYRGTFGDLDNPMVVIRRNYTLTLLIGFARHRYAPAYLVLAKLSEEGKILRYAPEYQYFLVLRARNLGLASSELNDLIQATEKRLDPKMLAGLQKRAELDYFGENDSRYR